MAKRQPKQIANATLLGQQGVNLIENLVHEMGFVWYPTGSVEAGIDGHIELRDPSTGEVFNTFIGVQSKATKAFANETPRGFDFYFEERDLEYWLRGNLPVIVIVSRPAQKEAYWLSVKDYFTDAARRASHKAHFDKADDKFDVTCRSALFRLGVSKNSGIYLAAPRKDEQLHSNLMEILLPDKIYLADTHFRDPTEAWTHIRQHGLGISGEWLLHNKRILSFLDLSRPAWATVCDRGTVEEFNVDEWSETDDIDKRRTFVNLLRRTLRVMVRADLDYHERLGLFFFRPTSDLSARQIDYQGLVNNTERTVFRAYTAPDGRVMYFRHSAFEDQFHMFNGRWHLSIRPTYYFTRDGYRLSGTHSGLLRGIKEIEGHEAVRGQILMWNAYFMPRGDLFNLEPYPFLSLKDPLRVTVGRGIYDEQWRPASNDESSSGEGGQLSSSNDGRLF